MKAEDLVRLGLSIFDEALKAEEVAEGTEVGSLTGLTVIQLWEILHKGYPHQWELHKPVLVLNEAVDTEPSLEVTAAQFLGRGVVVLRARPLAGKGGG